MLLYTQCRTVTELRAVWLPGTTCTSRRLIAQKVSGKRLFLRCAPNTHLGTQTATQCTLFCCVLYILGMYTFSCVCVFSIRCALQYIHSSEALSVLNLFSTAPHSFHTSTVFRVEHTEKSSLSLLNICRPQIRFPELQISKFEFPPHQNCFWKKRSLIFFKWSFAGLVEIKVFLILVLL